MSDLDIIKKIEKILNLKLGRLDAIGYYSKGYTLNQNVEVIGLGLYRCKIKNLNCIISLLKDLTNLTELNLRGNQIGDISQLKGLKKLRKLFLSDNHISDISPLKELKYLTKLNLSNNQVSDISPLKDLTKLTEVYLDKNQINNISPLKDIINLNRLDLTQNPIEKLPLWITDFLMEIRWSTSKYGIDGYITFHDNPLKIPPIEIVKQGKEAVKNYFNQIKDQQEDYLFEAKMLIVGEPGAGKTSMAWKIENPDCNLPGEEETTKGIDVRQYYFPLRKEDFSEFKHPEKLKNRKFRVNLWDFGGQEIYKATHRFFLSKRSLYSLVADSRNEDTDFNYWLHIVEMFGGESPLIIVLNEKFKRKRNIDIDAMQKRFTNISKVIDVDFAEDSKSRLNKLKKDIRYYISQLPLVGSPVPAKWTVVREALEKDKRNTITLKEYLDICEKNGITKSKDALVLSQYFHDIGVFLHFQDDSLLKKTIFLRPNWATHAVYQILDHDLINQKEGRFNKKDAEIIWSEDEYEFLHDELLKLMQKFFLTYKIDDSDEYIVPEHLPAEQPKYDWDQKKNLFLYYKYDLFMPRGIMSLFTVRMHRYISNHDYVWKKGVVLERDKTFAEVIETYDARRIKIRVSGKNKRDFMTIITEEIDRINSQYEKMKVEKMIPCNCDECKTADRPYFFEHNKLKRRLENNIDEIECENSFKRVNIRNLIDEVVGETNVRNKVLVSYSHKDKDWLKRVQTHLKVLEHEGITVNLWDDTKIKAGTKWRDEITKALTAAKVAILLVSTDFLASDFIQTDEIPPLLKAANKDGATILPLILKPCRFTKNAEISTFQAVNDPAKPLSKLEEHEQEEILLELADRIAELMKEQ
jgi:GTPase SAR1 family protein